MERRLDPVRFAGWFCGSWCSALSAWASPPCSAATCAATRWCSPHWCGERSAWSSRPRCGRGSRVLEVVESGDDPTSPHASTSAATVPEPAPYAGRVRGAPRRRAGAHAGARAHHARRRVAKGGGARSRQGRDEGLRPGLGRVRPRECGWQGQQSWSSGKGGAVSATTAPRSPMGRSEPTVESRTV